MTPSVSDAGWNGANTQTSSIRDCGSEAGAGSDIHPGEENGMLDLEQLCERCADGCHVCG